MKLRKISLCYYPTSILLIDDDKEYLKMLELGLASHWPCRFFQNSKTALHFLTQEYKLLPYTYRCIVNNEDSESDRISQQLNIRNIHHEIYNAKRFAEVSTVIIDYNMPDMNGVELSKKIRAINPLLKIIMLTGDADQSLAVSAFNEDVIDKFILKSTHNLKEVLVEAVQALQDKYFADLSDRCLSHVPQSKPFLTCLSDHAFVELFTKLCKENKISEYYLLDEYGSFLLLTEEGDSSWLLVKTAQEIDNYYTYAKQEEAPNNVNDALKSKQSILYFHTDSDLQMHPTQWEKYLQPATLLKGKEDYYYAYIKSPAAYELHPEKIISYHQFLDEQV